jgi:predicted nucleic acid-binding protein
VILYAESSAVLAWLLGEVAGGDVRRRLGAADAVVTSDLTLVECDRVLMRATQLGELSDAAAASRRGELGAAAAHWTLLRLGPDVIDRARQRFPREPVRALDALHLASVLAAKAAVPTVVVLSLDETIRANARALGCDVDPPDGRTSREEQ